MPGLRDRVCECVGIFRQIRALLGMEGVCRPADGCLHHLKALRSRAWEGFSASVAMHPSRGSILQSGLHSFYCKLSTEAVSPRVSGFWTPLHFL